MRAIAVALSIPGCLPEIGDGYPSGPFSSRHSGQRKTSTMLKIIVIALAVLLIVIVKCAAIFRALKGE